MYIYIYMGTRNEAKQENEEVAVRKFRATDIPIASFEWRFPFYQSNLKVFIQVVRLELVHVLARTGFPVKSIAIVERGSRTSLRMST